MSDEMDLDSKMVQIRDRNNRYISLPLSALGEPKRETAREFIEAFQFMENWVKVSEKLNETIRSSPSEFWDRVVAAQNYKISIDRYEEALAQLTYEVAPQFFKEHVTQGAENV